MSRTRVVKGNITKIVGGDYRRFSKGDIENIGSKVIQIGKEKGVSYENPETSPETPMLLGLEPMLKGEIIFCNGFHSSPIGAGNAALDVTIGLEAENKHLGTGENTHHVRGEINTLGTNTEVKPGDLDEDILSSSEVVYHENRPQTEEKMKVFPYPHKSKGDTESKNVLSKFKGYWNDATNKNQAIELYTTFFNAEKRDHYINGSHGMGSPAWERECHGVTLGYYWAMRNWKLKDKEEVYRDKEKNPNAESYSPRYRPLTFVGHSEGAAVAVGACIGAMYYAAEKGWDEIALNLILLGIHQPIALWSDETYDKNRKQNEKYITDYNTYKWFKTEVLEVSGNSPRLINELLASLRNVENAITPYGPSLAHIFTKDKNKQKYGIDEWTAKLLGGENWNVLKKRAIQFTFANDRADTVMLDGDIPGIANARDSEDDATLFGWREWQTAPLKGGITPNSDLTISVTDIGRGYMNTRIKIAKYNPEVIEYMDTTYNSWIEEFCEYHNKFKTQAVKYETKYREDWTTGKVYLHKDYILSNATKALEYAKIKDAHTEMMQKYVWVHHIELEAHFAPVGFINRPEIFNLPDGKTRNPMWPESEGKSIWDRIIKKAENIGDIFYRVSYDIDFFNRDLFRAETTVGSTIMEDIEEVKKRPAKMREYEKQYVNDPVAKNNLINPQIAYNVEVEKWVKVAKDSLSFEEIFKKLKENMEEQRKKYEREMNEIDYYNRNVW